MTVQSLPSTQQKGGAGDKMASSLSLFLPFVLAWATIPLTQGVTKEDTAPLVILSH